MTPGPQDPKAKPFYSINLRLLKRDPIVSFLHLIGLGFIAVAIFAGLAFAVIAASKVIQYFN